MSKGHTEGTEAPKQETASRAKSFSRRAVIQAGWSVPVIVALASARPVLAAPPAGGSPFGDRPFGDTQPRYHRRRRRRRR